MTDRVAKLREVLEARPKGRAERLATSVLHLAARVAGAREALRDPKLAVPAHVPAALLDVGAGLLDVAEGVLGIASPQGDDV